MPEEKKKDSFTFSDKIKSGTKTSSKSFANRISSKIGSDGKPRQTLFERTKRDAPFFIAALVALLLLPFLYKYSGQVAEEPTMITPGYEDAMVNPDRSGFDFTGDPEGQIAQLAGRDSMDLIVGFGKKGEEEEKDESLGDIYRSGLADSSASSYSRRNATEEEVNNTNIYKYRKDAAPQTRAAFRRAATKINSLRGAALSGRGGGRGITPWGGSMKSAASKVRAPGVRNSAKPVSLQPLVAAGKPSRSYFGQANADLARKSKDAMSKASAMQALMDAQFKPVEPSRIGGLGAGDFGGPGGGPGGLARNFTYNGKEPWWWDLMKVRAQKEWEAKFNYKWGWINWATGLVQNWLAGILNCAITGNSDGDPDTIFGAGGGTGSEPTCCGVKAKDWNADEYGAFGKKTCDKLKNEAKFNTAFKCSQDKWWDDGHQSDVRLNGLQQRWKCLGGKVKGAGAGLAAEVSDCENMVNEHYRVNPEGKARKWNKYVYVVARNYLPDNMKLAGSPVGYLCSPDSDRTRVNANYAAGGGAVNYSGLGTAEETRSEKYSHVKEYKEQHMSPSVHELDRESEADACVIYLANSDTLEPKSFHSAVLNMLIKRLGNKADAVKAYQSLEFMFVESFIAKDKLGYRSDLVDLPMTYDRFYNAYIRHKRTEAAAGAYTAGVYENKQYFTEHDKQAKRQSKADKQAERSKEGDAKRNEGKGKDKNRLDVDKRPYRTENEDYVMGQKCYFDSHVRIMCGSETGQAVVRLKQKYMGQSDPKFSKDKDNISVKVLANLNGEGGEGGSKRHEVTVEPSNEADSMRYYYYNPAGTKKDSWGYFLWTVYRNGRSVGTAECEYDSRGSNVITVTRECDEGSTQIVGNPEADGVCSSKVTCNRQENGLLAWDFVHAVANKDDKDCSKEKDKEVVEVEKIIEKEKIITEDCDCADFKPEKRKLSDDCEVEIFCRGKNDWQVRFIGQCGDKENDEVVTLPKKTFYLHSDVKTIPHRDNPYELDFRPDQENLNKTQDQGKLEWGQECKLKNTSLLLVRQPNAEVIAYMEAAKEQFEKDNKNAKLLLPEPEQFSIAHVIDAINIDPGKKGKVPANVVCLLGRTIGRASPDPTAHPSHSYPANDVPFDNVFGTFLAFIDYDMVYFPYQKYVRIDQEGNSSRAEFDKRFPCGTNYHWGSYVHGGVSTVYDNQINNGVWAGLPLRELKRNKIVRERTEQTDDVSRMRFVNEYRDLFSDEDCAYNSTDTVSRTNALEYISRLCQEGNYIKPHSEYRKCEKGSGSTRTEEQMKKFSNPNVNTPRPGSTK